MTMEPIRMPVLSDTMQSGRLVSWQKQVGDRVHKGELLAEVESDKAVMDLEAFRDGYLAGPLAAPDTDIPTGTVIGYLADRPVSGKENAPEPAPEGHPATPPPAPAAPPPVDTGPERTPSAPAASPTSPPAEKVPAPRASPYARGLARELGLDLRQIAPGSDGTIRSRQVLAAALAAPQPRLDAGPPWHYKLLSSMRRAVAENMSATLHTPMFRVSSELPVAPLRRLADSHQVSFTLLLARAAAQTVQAHPRFNMAYTPAGFAVREAVDVGIAVDVPGGLVTPVVRDLAACSAGEAMEAWRILKEKIRRQRLAPADYEGATFYLSNLGVFSNVRSFDAIVPLGAAAILALGAEHDGQAVLTLTCDHRVVYGADAARFLQTLGEQMEGLASWFDQ
ncbi:MAG TPA: 2-oxo acid dehydrogenase subunit E2 [Sedimenticola sp.]|nr:2-oxo acid dehydrogenase subunit E2 [Sedimenticola sp.]